MHFVIVICIPVQVIIIPLECNRNIPNVNFRSHITLAVNLWLLVHFLYLNMNYSHYNAIALFYRLCCAMWMFVYCYPNLIRSIYHWIKQRLPDCTRPFLRMIRDRLLSKVWRNFRAIIERRSRQETTVDNTSSLWTVVWVALHSKPKILWLSLHVITCISFSCLLKHYTGWDLTVIIPTLLLYLILRCNFYEEFSDIVSHLQSTAPNCTNSNRDNISQLPSIAPPISNDNSSFFSDIVNKLQSTAPVNFTDDNIFYHDVTQLQYTASLGCTDGNSFYGNSNSIIQSIEPVSCSNSFHGNTVSQFQSTAADYSSVFISHSNSNSFHGGMEKLIIEITEPLLQ